MTQTNKEWNLHMRLDYVLNKHIPAGITCPRCKGRRRVGGGPMSWDEEHDCPECYGSGTIDNPNISHKPELPKEFVDYMTKCFYAYFKD